MDTMPTLVLANYVQDLVVPINYMCLSLHPVLIILGTIFPDLTNLVRLFYGTES